MAAEKPATPAVGARRPAPKPASGAEDSRLGGAEDGDVAGGEGGHRRW